MIASSSTTDKKKVRDFPKIMKGNGYTILFSASERGTIIHKDKVTLGKGYPVGEHSNGWGMEHFKDTDVKITLCSKQ